MLPNELMVRHGSAVVSGGVRSHYVEAGEGPLVLLLHGFPENHWSWRYQIGPLAKAGFRVVAPDLRGYNDSDKSGPYDLHTISADVCGLMGALGAERAHVVGHDWGGAVAWHLAAFRPEKVQRIAVVNCPHPARMAEALRTRWRQMMRSWFMFFAQLPLLPEWGLLQVTTSMFARMYAGDGALFSDQELRPFVEGLHKPGAVHAMLGWYRTAFWGAVKRLGALPEYPPIAADVLLLWGKRDFALGYDDLVPGTERYAPRLRIEVLERGGHFVHAAEPARVNQALLDFLSAGAPGVQPAPPEVTVRHEVEVPVAEAAPPEAEVPAPEVAPPEAEVPVPEAAPPARTAFNVILADAGENKIGVIRELRDLIGLDVRQARDFLEEVPRTIRENASWPDAERIKNQLTAAGATVEIT